MQVDLHCSHALPGKVCAVLELLALLKMNILFWEIGGPEGWRIPVTKALGVDSGGWPIFMKFVKNCW